MRTQPNSRVIGSVWRALFWFWGKSEVEHFNARYSICVQLIPCRCQRGHFLLKRKDKSLLIRPSQMPLQSQEVVTYYIYQWCNSSCNWHSHNIYSTWSKNECCCIWSWLMTTKKVSNFNFNFKLLKVILKLKTYSLYMVVVEINVVMSL